MAVPPKAPDPKTRINSLTQTMEVPFVPRDEIEYGMDYLEEMCNETKDKVCQLNQWKIGIDRRVADVENGDPIPQQLKQWKKEMDSKIAALERNNQPKQWKGEMERRMGAIERRYADFKKGSERTRPAQQLNEPPVDAVSQRANSDNSYESIWDDAEEADVNPKQAVTSPARKVGNDLQTINEHEEILNISDDIVIDNPYSPLDNDVPQGRRPAHSDGETVYPKRGRGARARGGKGNAQQRRPGSARPNQSMSDDGTCGNKTRENLAKRDASKASGQVGRDEIFKKNVPEKTAPSKVPANRDKGPALQDKADDLPSTSGQRKQGPNTRSAASRVVSDQGNTSKQSRGRGRAVATSVNKKREQGMPAAKKMHVASDFSSSTSCDDDVFTANTQESEDNSDSDGLDGGQADKGPAKQADASVSTDSCGSYADVAAKVGVWNKNQEQETKMG